MLLPCVTGSPEWPVDYHPQACGVCPHSAKVAAAPPESLLCSRQDSMKSVAVSSFDREESEAPEEGKLSLEAGL